MRKQLSEKLIRSWGNGSRKGIGNGSGIKGNVVG